MEMGVRPRAGSMPCRRPPQQMEGGPEGFQPAGVEGRFDHIERSAVAAIPALLGSRPGRARLDLAESRAERRSDVDHGRDPWAAWRAGRRACGRLRGCLWMAARRADRFRAVRPGCARPRLAVLRTGRRAAAECGREFLAAGRAAPRACSRLRGCLWMAAPRADRFRAVRPGCALPRLAVLRSGRRAAAECGREFLAAGRAAPRACSRLRGCLWMAAP